jgi:putative flippase GtrA
LKNIFVVIPTLDPDQKIMESFIKELKKEFTNILVVNDGSDESHNKFFEKLDKSGVTIITHFKNLGKGRALKSAFNYILNAFPTIDGVVTCDCDGQHSVKDIKKCAQALLKNPDKLILGVRDFSKDDVPKRSRFGNKTTRNVFKLFVGIDISDTQTGLRGLSKELMLEFLDISGERYEYETNILIECQRKNIKIKEVGIDTIYIDSNSNSHFNPIKDSIKIYRLFIKYILVALSSYILELILFASLLSIFKINGKILAATIIARVLSTIYNYFVNKNTMFKNSSFKILAKYYILVTIQMFISGCFVAYLFNLTGSNVILIKILVDLILWMVNVFIKRDFVFTGVKK